MSDLKKLKRLEIQLPENFEQNVWKAIYTRMPQHGAVRLGIDWGDMLWMQPAWLGGLACAVLLTGVMLGDFHANLANNDSIQTTEQYVNSLGQVDPGENVL